MERRMRGNSHVRCGAGENLEITSKSYLSLKMPTLRIFSQGWHTSFEMIATAMESKRLGLCSKSLFAVPNHLTEQVGADFMKLYPNANILVATKQDFTKKNRSKLLARIATGNYDAVIIGHSQLGMIPLSPERQERMYKEQIDDITKGIAELKAQNGEKFQVKAMERTRKSLQQKLEKLSSSKKDNTMYFEELGIDKLFVDEAHEFKNLMSVTKLQNVSGISGRTSQRATELFMKCRYLDEKTGGNRSTVCRILITGYLFSVSRKQIMNLLLQAINSKPVHELQATLICLSL